jgi:hypothetical protein
MPQTHKGLYIFILSGEAKLHRGFYENQYNRRFPIRGGINGRIVFKRVLASRRRCTFFKAKD